MRGRERGRETVNVHSTGRGGCSHMETNMNTNYLI